MVKEIRLTQGKVALVDDQDYDYLNQWKWQVTKYKDGRCYAVRKHYLGYSEGKRQQKTVRMHRLITNAQKGMVVDHINHNPLDNRRENLRVVSQRQNMQNTSSHGSSKFPGVFWEKSRKRWCSHIKVKEKWKHLGYFTDEREAAKAYERACRELGEELVCKLGKR